MTGFLTESLEPSGRIGTSQQPRQEPIEPMPPQPMAQQPPSTPSTPSTFFDPFRRTAGGFALYGRRRMSHKV